MRNRNLILVCVIAVGAIIVTGFVVNKLWHQNPNFTYFKKAAEKNPQDANAWYKAGYGYDKLGCYQEAIEAYKQAIKINPDYVEAHYNLGIAYSAAGDKGSALEEYKILRTLDSELAYKMFNLIYNIAGSTGANADKKLVDSVKCKGLVKCKDLVKCKAKPSTGLIIFICAGLVMLVIIIVAKISSVGSNSSPEDLQADVQPVAFAPSTQILEEENKVTKRSIFLRILFGFLWFIPIYLLSNMIIGGIVGAFAGRSTTTFEEGYNAGRTASIDFFQKYGLFILLAQIILTVVLSVAGFLPGTGRHKKIKTVKSDSLSSIDEESAQMVLASSWQRLGNMFLDTIFYLIFAFIFGIVSYLIGIGDLVRNMNNNILGLIILLIYYVPQETFSGRTLGKLITGTKAVSKDGSDLTFGQALVRTLCRFIPFEAFSFLGGKGTPRGWHDKIPKTKVISLRKMKLGTGTETGDTPKLGTGTDFSAYKPGTGTNFKFTSILILIQS